VNWRALANVEKAGTGLTGRSQIYPSRPLPPSPTGRNLTQQVGGVGAHCHRRGRLGRMLIRHNGAEVAVIGQRPYIRLQSWRGTYSPDAEAGQPDASDSDN
jgi:hypothetical protein